MIFTHQKTGPGFFIRALWYICIGWWASGFAILAAYFAIWTIVGIPLAFFIFNRLPTILTLRPRTLNWSVQSQDGVTSVRAEQVQGMRGVDVDFDAHDFY